MRRSEHVIAARLAWVRRSTAPIWIRSKRVRQVADGYKQHLCPGHCIIGRRAYLFGLPIQMFVARARCVYRRRHKQRSCSAISTAETMIGSAGEIRSSRLVATRVHVPARYRPASPAGVRILELRAASRRARTIVSHAHCRFEDSLSGHSSDLNLRMRRGTISLPMWNDQRRSHESQTRAMKLEHVVPPDRKPQTRIL